MGVGGTPASFSRAGRLGLPLFIAMLSGPARFRRLVELYRESAAAAGHDAGALPVGAGGHFYAAPLLPCLLRAKHATPRGSLPPFHLRFLDRTGGGLLVGSPQQLTEKLLEIHQSLGNTRYLAQVGLGGLPFAETARSIELLATEILPAVNREIRPAGVGAA